MSAHAFRAGRLRSICGQIRLPVGFSHGSGRSDARCVSCQRAVISKLSQEWAANEDPTIRWRERATVALMGEGWTYASASTMPSYKRDIDRVAVELAEVFREGLLQGSAPE